MSLPSDEPQSPLPIGDLPKTLHGLPGITDAGVFLQEDLLGTCGTDVAVGTAAELFRTFNQPPFTMFSFVYRGQSSRFCLMPTLERLLWGTRPVKAGEQVERDLVQQFRRHLHHYIEGPPAQENVLEILALMRHHGVPSRLLDCSRSPYVAAFFAAVEDTKEDFAVWAINADTLRTESQAVFKRFNPLAREHDILAEYDDVFLRDIMNCGTPPVVLPVEPLRSNQRTLAQQGLFLCANTHVFSFEDCLKYVLRHGRESGRLRGTALFKVRVPGGQRAAVLRELARMNISYATLFPGLDGFARSLDTNLRLQLRP